MDWETEEATRVHKDRRAIDKLIKGGHVVRKENEKCIQDFVRKTERKRKFGMFKYT
jgi:hypothetical protein